MHPLCWDAGSITCWYPLREAADVCRLHSRHESHEGPNEGAKGEAGDGIGLRSTEVHVDGTGPSM